MESINQTSQRVVRVTGKGDTKQKAFASALSQIQKKVIQNETAVTLQITPNRVLPVELQDNSYKEHFLFFFFPRIRHEFTVTIDVEVTINAIDLATVPFTKNDRQNADFQATNILKGGK